MTPSAITNIIAPVVVILCLGAIAVAAAQLAHAAQQPAASSTPDLWPDPAELDEFLRDTYATREASADRAGLTLATYQAGARTTAQYPNRGLTGLYYAALGAAGEAGELGNKVKKLIRDHNEILTDEMRSAIADEAGDLLWYLAAIAHEIGIPLDEVARRNLAKLRDRQRRGTIGGSGDHR